MWDFAPVTTPMDSRRLEKAEEGYKATEEEQALY
jgi:hypothetical protein